MEEGLRLWRVQTAGDTKAKALFPGTSPSVAKLSVEGYADWWKQIGGEYLENHLDQLIVKKSVHKNLAPSGVSTKAKRKQTVATNPVTSLPTSNVSKDASKKAKVKDSAAEVSTTPVSTANVSKDTPVKVKSNSSAKISTSLASSSKVSKDASKGK